MVEYRRFRNTDPPQIRRLWDACGLGRGAALHLNADAFETVVFAQPYFDPEGLILAWSQGEAVGFVHAGFRANADESALDYAEGVICAVMVAPPFRRQGIGRELVRQAEEYLLRRGARHVFAGPAHPRDPFYFGIYGGSQPAGFLASDPLADPFFRRLGYEPVERHLVYQRHLEDTSDPIGLRLMALRKSTQLTAAEVPSASPWWWQTRSGRLDTVELMLSPKGNTECLARVTAIGLDFYLPCWNQRAIGLIDLQVAEALRRKGYAQALLVEVCRRLRSEMIQIVEGHAAEHDVAAIKLLESARFHVVDTGVVYRKSEPMAPLQTVS
jgi:ribosomal protein S18 acetylase RimI-like enzyme